MDDKEEFWAGEIVMVRWGGGWTVGRMGNSSLIEGLEMLGCNVVELFGLSIGEVYDGWKNTNRKNKTNRKSLLYIVMHRQVY